MKKCKYRNCNKDIFGRSDKEYCNRSCKTQEQTYKKREMKKLLKNGEKVITS